MFFALLLNVVDYDVIVDAWPYDFGREHGKNFIAPSAVFFLMVWYLIRRAFIASFLNEKAIVEIKQFYRSESIEQKEHDYLINIDTFLFLPPRHPSFFKYGPLLWSALHYFPLRKYGYGSVSHQVKARTNITA